MQDVCVEGRFCGRTPRYHAIPIAGSAIAIARVVTPPIPLAVSRRYDRAMLEADRAPIVILDEAHVIVWANPAWFRFFEDNGGRDLALVQLGASYLAGIQGKLREFYKLVFETCRESGLPFEQDYECSSATEQRFYRLRALPVENRDLVVSHQLRSVSARPDAPEATPDFARYVSPEGIVVQCSNCRRLRTVEEEPTWEWVAEAVRAPPRRVSHGICHLCEGHYYFGGHDP